MATSKTAKKASSAKPRKRAPKKRQPTDVEIVKATAAAPHASRAGTEHVLESEDVPLKITVHDGARATLELAKHEPLSQAELQAIGKLVNQAVQETY